MKNTHQLRFAMLLAQFSFTSVALAAGKLTPAPEAANEYVRVWSDTIGVHEVQNPDGGLDFWITTTNVVDGFTAEVVVEEIDEDSWRLKEPQSGKRNQMSPGDKLKYVVEDVSGVEPDKTGWIKLYRVDVMIDDVGETNEETVGSFLDYADSLNGYNDPGLKDYLKPVSIRCFTPDESDTITIRVQQSTLLVRNKGSSLQKVKDSSQFVVSELSDKEFYLLGDSLSTSDRDQFIEVTHDKSHCKDNARFTVYRKSDFVVKSVTFNHNIDLQSDDGTDFDKPQYLDRNANGKTDDTGDRASPICYVRNSRPNVTAVFKRFDEPYSTVYIRGEGTGFSIPPVQAQRGNLDEIKIETVSATKPLKNVIDYQDPCFIQWFASTDNRQTWMNAGCSTNRLYVVWGQPAATCNIETLFYIGCRGANGIGGTAPGIVFLAIWNNQFATKSITRACDGSILSYYGFLDKNGNGIFDQGDEDFNGKFIKTLQGLVEKGSGNCQAWAELFVQTLAAQGITHLGDFRITSQQQKPSRPYNGYAIKNWEKNGSGELFVEGNTRQRRFKIHNHNAGVAGTEEDPSTQIDECWDVLGIPGQGNSPNPPSLFDCHYFVRVGERIVDPSYGIGICQDFDSYADRAIEGKTIDINRESFLCTKIGKEQ